MKIIIISLIAILFSGCSSNKNGSTIPETNARFLRKSNADLIQVTDKTKLEMNDYVIFTKDSNKSISIDALKNETPGTYFKESYSECKIANKNYSYTNHLSQNAIQLKSILPLEFFLSSNSQVVCSFKITLQNGGTSKTFSFSGATIRNINSDTQALLGDEKATPLSQSLESISESELDHYTIMRTEQNDEVSLICENFRTIPEKINLDVLKLQKLARLTRILSYGPDAVDPRSYVPYQDCIVHLKKRNGVSNTSSRFKMKFTPVEPSIHLIERPYALQDPPDYYDPFYIDLSNTQSQAVTIVLDKSKLTLNVDIHLEKCNRHDHCWDYVANKLTPTLKPSFSIPEAVIERQNMYLIHLVPGQSLRIVFSMTIYDTYHSLHWIKFNANTKRDILQNLHSNYLSLEEIPESPEMIGPIQE